MKTLEDFGLILSAVVIASILITLAVITLPLWLLGVMVFGALAERFPKVERSLQGLGITLKS